MRPCGLTPVASTIVQPMPDIEKRNVTLCEYGRRMNFGVNPTNRRGLTIRAEFNLSPSKKVPMGNPTQTPTCVRVWRELISSAEPYGAATAASIDHFRRLLPCPFSPVCRTALSSIGYSGNQCYGDTHLGTSVRSAPVWGSSDSSRRLGLKNFKPASEYG